MAEITSNKETASGIAQGIKEACSALDVAHTRSSGYSDLRVALSHESAYADLMSHNAATVKLNRAYANRLSLAGTAFAAVDALVKGAWK